MNPAATTTGAAAGRRPRRAAVLRLLGTVAALVAGQAVLWRAGAALPTLPLEPAGAARAFDEADPLALAVAAVRLLALAVGAGLLAVTALGITARCCGAARLVVGVDRWTPPSLRRLLDGALGVGLAASIGLGAAPAGADDRPAAGTTIQRLADVPASTLRRLPDVPAPAGPPGLSLRRLPDGPPAPPSAAPAPPEATSRGSPPEIPSPAHAGAPGAAAVAPPGDQSAPAPPATAPAPAPAPAAAPPATAPAPPAATAAGPPGGQAEVVVRPGESFWRLAERHEAARLGRQPTEAEIGACWHELVAVNRHRLAVPGDPDLLFPGQRLILPCP